MESVVKKKFDSYPVRVRERLIKIRALIFEVAREEKLGDIRETLKWSEPSYSSKNGSPIRLDWKLKYPNHVSVYFNCNTRLIDTFKQVYPGVFQCLGNREIVLPISKPLPMQQLKGCISKALRYHSIKHLPLLGG